MPNDDRLNVSEAGAYRSLTQGPISDSHAFSQETPMAGAGRRDDLHDPSLRERRDRSVDSQPALPKIPIRNLRAEEIKASLDDRLGLVVLAATILLFSLGGLAVAREVLRSFQTAPPAEASAPAQAPEPEDLKGIPVRKDLNAE